MKLTYLITTAAVLLTNFPLSVSGFVLSFFNPHPLIGGFDGFKEGMIWGVVVNTSPGSSDFTALDNGNLSVDQFQSGVGASGQWLTDNLIYLTGSDGSDNSLLPRTAPITGALGSLSALPFEVPDSSGDPYEIQPDSNFALIWFDIYEAPSSGSESIIPDPSRDKYGYINLPDFKIPSAGATGAFYNLKNENLNRLANLSFAPVPEPATYALLLSGLVLAGCVVRRRRGKVTA